MSVENIIQVEELVKVYPGDVKALSGIDFSVGRDECLNEHWFNSVTEAKAIVEAWRQDYNTVRPHNSLGNRTPEQAVREDMPLAAGLA